MKIPQPSADGDTKKKKLFLLAHETQRVGGSSIDSIYLKFCIFHPLSCFVVNRHGARRSMAGRVGLRRGAYRDGKGCQTVPFGGRESGADEGINEWGRNICGIVDVSLDRVPWCGVADSGSPRTPARAGSVSWR